MRQPVKDHSRSVKSRGRPRSEEARRAIMKAARELLAEGGPSVLTMEGVASRAGVGKPTVYRWWPDRHAVAMAALMEADLELEMPSARRTAMATLREQLRTIARRFATTTGRQVTSMIAASEPESELSKAFRNHFVLTRRSEGKTLLERGIATGEIRGDLDVEVALDLLYGALFFRLLMGHGVLDERFVDAVLEGALVGMKPRGRSR